MHMTRSDPDSSTAFDLARRFGLYYWPKPCRVCGGNAPQGRVLQLAPSRRGNARYRCRECLTTVTIGRRRVVQQIERLGLYSLPRRR